MINSVRRLRMQVALLGAGALLALCSSCKNPVGSLDFSGTHAPPRAATVTIESSGFVPNTLTVQPAGQVTFENRDGVAHQIVSTCSQLNTAPIAAGARLSVTMGSTVGSCPYHDRADETKHGTVDVCREVGLFSCR